MAGANRITAYAVVEPAEVDLQKFDELLRKLAERPFDFDFFQALRQMECARPDKPRIGTAAKPSDEPVRFGQEPSLAFAPRTLASLRSAAGRRRNPKLDVFFFGIFGPNGPMPLHLTEFVRERSRSHDDPTLARFADMFHHRLLELFYRAWAASEPVVQFDREAADHFSRQLGALSGIGSPALQNRNNPAIVDATKLHYTGLLSSQTGSAEGLRVLVQDFLQLPVRIDQFVGQWLELGPEGMTRLGATPLTGSLGQTAVIGARVWDRQHKFRIIIGPLKLADYLRLLPGGVSLERLVVLIRNYSTNSLDWDLKLILSKDQVPPLQLGVSGSLGWSTWAASEPFEEDQDQLELNAAFFVPEQPSQGNV